MIHYLKVLALRKYVVYGLWVMMRASGDKAFLLHSQYVNLFMRANYVRAAGQRSVVYERSS